jgi:hypothetical protein
MSPYYPVHGVRQGKIGEKMAKAFIRPRGSDIAAGRIVSLLLAMFINDDGSCVTQNYRREVVKYFDTSFEVLWGTYIVVSGPFKILTSRPFKDIIMILSGTTILFITVVANTTVLYGI